MDNPDTEVLTTEQGISANDWELAFRVLQGLLASNNGCVGSRTVRRELEDKYHIANARDLVVALKYFDPESSREPGMPAPSFKFRHLDRSFYSEERYAQELQTQEDKTTREADDASRKALAVQPEEPTVSRTNRQEEARLVTYVKKALEELYGSDPDSDDDPFVFDVHSARKGNSFENVDLIAIHRRPHNTYEVITVEVKLDFIPQVVQQALSYTRFSHRAWVAVRVRTDSHSELREVDPSLFEYAISRGLGLLACRRAQGRRYDVFPVHWPLRQQLDPSEEEGLKERYRSEFEDAGIIERERKKLPRSR